MKSARLLFVVAALAALVVHAAGRSITVTTTDGAQGGAGSVCTAASDLGNIKTWNLQCAHGQGGTTVGYQVYVRTACATNSASCILDAGYGDPVYDFRLNANDHLPPPARILLRTSETRICIRNTLQPPDAATADAGDAFKCFLNEQNPF